MNEDKFINYGTAITLAVIGLVVLALTSAVTYKLVMWIIEL